MQQEEEHKTKPIEEEEEPTVWIEGWERHLDVARKILGRNSVALNFIDRLPIKCQAKCQLLVDLLRENVVVMEKENKQDDV